MAMESLSKRNGISMLDCETYKSIRYNPFVPPSASGVLYTVLLLKYL